MLGNGSMRIRFSRPFSPSTSASSIGLAAGNFPFIWAFNDAIKPDPIDSSTPTLQKHVFSEPMGRIVLFESAPDTGSSEDEMAPIPVSADKADPKNPIILAHGILMFAAWGVFAPIGATVAMFAKRQPWFPVHFYTMSLLVFTCTVAGFILAVYYIASQSIRSFTNYHEIIGLTVVICAVIQAALGFYIHHLYDPNRTHRPVRNYVHIWFGRAVFGLGVANVALGIQRYGTWYSMSSTTNPIMYGYIGFIVGWTLLCGIAAFSIRRSVMKSKEVVRGESSDLLKAGR